MSTETRDDIVSNDQIGNVTGQLFLQYGTPTVTLSSSRMQITGDDLGAVDIEILDDDFELLIGAK